MKPLRIAVTTFPPFSNRVQNESYSTLGYKGYLSEFYEAFSASTGIEQKTEFLTYDHYGKILPNGTWTGIIGRLARNEIDVSGPFSITYDKYRVMDLAAPLRRHQIAIASGFITLGRDRFVALRTFSIQVWLATLAFLCLVTATACLLYGMSKATAKRKIVSVAMSYVWILSSSIMGKGFGSSNQWCVKPIYFNLGFRILIGSWLLGPGMVFVYAFQGGITSAFSAAKVVPEFATTEDIRKNSEVVPVIFPVPFVVNCLKEHYGWLWERVENKDQTLLAFPWSEMMENVARGTHVLLGPKDTLMYLIGSRFITIRKCGVHLTPLPEHCSHFLTLGVSKKMKKSLKKIVMNKVRRYAEAMILEKYTREVFRSFLMCQHQTESSFKALELDDFFAAFTILASGLGLSALVLLLEILSRKCCADDVTALPRRQNATEPARNFRRRRETRQRWTESLWKKRIKPQKRRQDHRIRRGPYY